MSDDWMPDTIQDRIFMGRNWITVISVRAAAWKIPAGDVNALCDAVNKAENAQQAAASSMANSITCTFRDRMIDTMTAVMRNIKNRYLHIPPLEKEDFSWLGLRIPDTMPQMSNDPPQSRALRYP